MRRICFIILTIFPFLLIGQVEHVYLQSKMDATITLSDGHQTNFWGYGYQSTNPNARVTLPAPKLVFEKGDSVVIHFYNNSPEDHTIHLHGLDVNQVNDGVPSTSFAVGSQDSVNYSFRVSHTGTYLYHCHVLTSLHLTMGMYGMIVVTNGDDHLYDGGPKYNREFDYLTSDMKRAVNDNPLSPGDFFHIYADYFMLNGKADQQIFDDTTLSIDYRPADTMVFRIGNIAYSCTKWIFPDELDVTVYQSDGREVPVSFQADTLMVYPGERFTAIAIPNGIFQDTIEVEYCNMSDGSTDGVNKIPIRLDPAHLSLEETLSEELNPLKIFPNPAENYFKVEVQDDQSKLKVVDMQGRIIIQKSLDKGIQTIRTSDLESGVYFVFLNSRQTQLVISK